MPTNREISELLLQEGQLTTGKRSEALLTAARSAYLWPREVSELAKQEESLLQLEGLSGSAYRLVCDWLERPPSIPPAPVTRAGFMTMAEALKMLSKKPAWQKKLRGDLQMHTTWSDGHASILEMTATAIERGYQYLAITDHSAGLAVAHGMDERGLAAQGQEIARVNAALHENGIAFRVLRSLEMNLSSNGTGDMHSRALKNLDLVLGAFHSGLSSRRDETPRYLAAIRNPQVNILAHPQTRRWGRRAGLRADWARVFGEAAHLGKAVEIDGYVERQDLSLDLLKLAKAEGTLISLASDAHRPEQMRYILFALAAALSAHIPRAQIINFWDAETVVEWAKINR